MFENIDKMKVIYNTLNSKRKEVIKFLKETSLLFIDYVMNGNSLITSFDLIYVCEYLKCFCSLRLFPLLFELYVLLMHFFSCLITKNCCLTMNHLDNVYKVILI